MHRILIELRDNQAAALFGFLLSFLWIVYARKGSLRSTKDVVLACVLLLAGTAAIGWTVYSFAYMKKILIFEPSFHVNWDLCLSFWTGGRGMYPVRSYGVAMASAFAANMWLVYYRAPKEGLDRETVINACLLVIVGTLIGGRALFVITQWADYKDNPLSVLYFWEGGLVFYGGAIGSFLCVMAYMWFVRRGRFLPVSDLLSPYGGLGLAIHRAFGCYMNGCCYGRPTTVPWGVQFPIDHPGTEHFGAAAYLHPTQLYEAINGLSIFLVLLLLRPYRKYQGQSTGIMLMMYAVNRYLIELLRGDLLRGTVGEFSTSQFISLVVFGLGLFLMVLGPMTKRRVLPPLTESEASAAHSQPLAS